MLKRETAPSLWRLRIAVDAKNAQLLAMEVAAEGQIRSSPPSIRFNGMNPAAIFRQA